MYNLLCMLGTSTRHKLPLALSVTSIPHRLMHTGVYPENIVIRNVTRNELNKILQIWAFEEGWNPGKFETDAFYAADPQGYYLLEADGKPAASLAGVKYSSNFAFMGLYIVRPEFRGLGLGLKLWNSVMQTLAHSTTIGLDGVIQQVKNYNKSGFNLLAPNYHWQGKSDQIARFDSNKLTLNTVDCYSETELIDYDAGIFSVPRPGFLSEWFKMQEAHTLFTRNSHGRIIGYGVISQCLNGYQIGPLFADNDDIALNLYIGLCRKVKPNIPIHTDVTNANPQIDTLMKQLGLIQGFSTMRMYRGVFPAIDYKKTFSLTTIDIG